MSLTSGLLIIDKPQGVTSFDVVAAVRGALHIKKVGHAGTLDPMATGVLIVGFGHVTRLLNPIVGHSKTYETTIRLGQRTATDDADGDIITVADAEEAHRIADRVRALGREQIEQTIAEHLTGAIEQVPSTFSAIKINGQRAYDLARDGQNVELAARPVTIDAFDVEAVRTGTAADGTPVVDVDARVSCSSGTYIRSLGRDLGDLLGVGGHLVMLRRTRVGRFDLADPAIAVHVVTAHAEPKTFTNRDGETITRNRAVLDLPEGLRGADRALALIDHALPAAASARLCMPCLDITADEASELRYGRRIERFIEGPTAAILPHGGTQENEQEDELIAILDQANAHQAKPVTVFAGD